MRNANFQTISWFWDLHQRTLLDLDPPYQRRSVWNQSYKDYFIDTVLNSYPAPAVFLYQEISPEGTSEFAVVDGKQRLSALFDFAKNRFPVSDDATINNLRGKYFKDFDDDTKKAFWGYQFSVEYLPSSEEKIINTIFDRINRNVAKLTAQELRHAKYDGEFITKVEEINDWMILVLPNNLPVISQRSKKQMKDVEFTTQLVLLLEEGPKSYSQLELDKAYAEREESWELREEVESKFRKIILSFEGILSTPNGSGLVKSRLKNQADFYSLFGAIAEIIAENLTISAEEIADRLNTFVTAIDNEVVRNKNRSLIEYFEAARSASNDAGPRRVRIGVLKDVILGRLSI